MNSMVGNGLVDALNLIGGIGSAEECIDRAEERDNRDYDGDGDINGVPVTPDPDEGTTTDDTDTDTDTDTDSDNDNDNDNDNDGDTSKGDESDNRIISTDMPWLQDMVDSAGGIEELTTQLESMSVMVSDYATDLRAAQSTLVDLVDE